MKEETYFYLRISTKEKKEEDKEKDQEQTFERQKGILERVGYTLTEKNTFADRISGGTKANERENFEAMLQILCEGDWVIFTETSRFSRSYVLGMEMLDILIYGKKVNIRFVSNGIEILAGEKFNPYTWFTISQMLLADELQRRVISFNTINGLERKKEQGIILGRKSKMTEENFGKLAELYADKSLKIPQIAELMNLSHPQITKMVRKLVNDGVVEPRSTGFGVPKVRGQRKVRVLKGRNDRKLNQEQEDLLLFDYYINNMTIKQVCEKYGIYPNSFTYISRRAIESGKYEPKRRNTFGRRAV